MKTIFDICFYVTTSRCYLATFFITFLFGKVFISEFVFPFIQHNVKDLHVFLCVISFLWVPILSSLVLKNYVKPTFKYFLFDNFKDLLALLRPGKVGVELVDVPASQEVPTGGFPDGVGPFSRGQDFPETSKCTRSDQNLNTILRDLEDYYFILFL